MSCTSFQKIGYQCFHGSSVQKNLYGTDFNRFSLHIAWNVVTDAFFCQCRIDFIVAAKSEYKICSQLLQCFICLNCSSVSYALRWGIEGKYLELKERLEIEEFSGSRDSSIKQDFFISMFKSNLVAILKADADHAIEEAETKKKTTCNYQANRSFLINRVHKHLVRLLIEPPKAYKVLSDIVKMAKKIRSQIQPDRKCERKHRQLRRKHHNNRKPCL